LAQWNAIPGVQKAREMTKHRKANFRARLLNPTWRVDYPEAMKRVGKSSFCRGVNDREWRANIDWFLQPDTVTRILEGKYDGRSEQEQSADNDRTPVTEKHLEIQLGRPLTDVERAKFLQRNGATTEGGLPC
jgi:hypothetical protein